MTKPRTAKNTPRGVKALPQPFPQTMTDPYSLARAHGMMQEDMMNEGSTSKRINEGTMDKTTTWRRPCDDMRALPTPDKNRHVYSDADNAAISSGGVRDPKTHVPTYSDGNRV